MATNLRIKIIKSLQQKKNRLEHRLFVAEGRKLVLELLDSKFANKIDAIYTTADFIDQHPFSHPKLEVVGAKDMERMTSMQTPPEILAVVHFLPEPNLKTPSRLALYLDGIQDPGNLGTIIRTSEWYGIQQIVLSPNCVDIYNPKTIQATMGSIFRVEVGTQNLSDYLETTSFSQVIGTTLSGINIRDFEVKHPCLIVLGSESHGMQADNQKRCSDLVTIPNFGSGESLNVTIAAAIVMDRFTS
jgi:TrmH family RNA methyltransferase